MEQVNQAGRRYEAERVNISSESRALAADAKLLPPKLLNFFPIVIETPKGSKASGASAPPN